MGYYTWGTKATGFAGTRKLRQYTAVIRAPCRYLQHIDPLFQFNALGFIFADSRLQSAEIVKHGGEPRAFSASDTLSDELF